MTEKLPTYSDYVNVEELYDVEEIKELYLQASQQRAGEGRSKFFDDSEF